MKDIIKRKDVILIVVVLIVAAIGFGVKFLFAEKGGTVTISVDGKTYGTYSLNENKTINVDDHNKVVIKDGVVHMEDADCPDKLCIKQGKIDSNGQKIVCLPNKTIVEVSSEKESDYDVKVK
nr:NusG domain II-containing protein [uncultured Intestinibacter sp.]